MLQKQQFHDFSPCKNGTTGSLPVCRVLSQHPLLLQSSEQLQGSCPCGLIHTLSQHVLGSQHDGIKACAACALHG